MSVLYVAAWKAGEIYWDHHVLRNLFKEPSSARPVPGIFALSQGGGLPHVGQAARRVQLSRKLIADLRKRLLDLSTKNRLLSFKFGKTTRQVVNQLPDALYDKLVSGTQLVFVALPEADLIPKDERTPEFRRALEAARAREEDFRSNRFLSDAEKERLERKLQDKVRQELGMERYISHLSMQPEEWARLKGKNPSYDLPFSQEELGDSYDSTSNKLQLLLFPNGTTRDRQRREGRGGHVAVATGLLCCG